MSDGNSGGGGIGFCGLLTVLFIGLKLTDHIDWSWWWVLSPLWLPIAIVLGSLAFVFVVAGVVTAIAAVIAAIIESFYKIKSRR